jgi:hypothetical protein
LGAGTRTARGKFGKRKELKALPSEFDQVKKKRLKNESIEHVNG